MTTPSPHPNWPRRRLITVAASGVLAACTTTPNQTSAPTLSAAPSATASAGVSASPGKPLIVYFSRAGENYYNGGRRMLTVGNTEVLAKQLAGLLRCDTHRLEAADPYPNSYDDCVERNTREQNEQARPAIANPLTSLAGYTTVLIGSPIWSVQAPRIMRTFIDANDFTGITVAPFTTYAMSGLGGVPDEYARACRGAASITAGLAVRGEEAEQAGQSAQVWLSQIGLL